MDPLYFVQSGEKVIIESALGGQFAHVYGGGTENGTNITTWQYVNQDNLKWTIKPSENNGYFYIVSEVDHSHQRVLHQHGANHDNGGNVTLWERVNQGNTQVRFEPAGNGYWYIIFAHSNKCVHVHGGGVANGTNITQWEKVDQANLKWRFLRIPGSEDATHIPPGVPHIIRSVKSKHVLDVYNNGLNNGEKLIQYHEKDVNENKNQLFTFEASKHQGYYHIRAVHSGKVLDVNGASHDDRAAIIQYDLHGGDNQCWQVSPLAPGKYRITAKHSGKVLDVEGGSVDDLAHIIQFGFHGGENQQWEILPFGASVEVPHHNVPTPVYQQPFQFVHFSQSPSPPPGSVLATQHNAQTHVAVAHSTPYGEIPGKAKGDTCWYPYNGAEHTTNNFSWVVVNGGHLVRANGAPPPNAVASGFQTDINSKLYAAVAHHPTLGDIPGKAWNGQVWIPYGGQEHTGVPFSYVCHS